MLRHYFILVRHAHPWFGFHGGFGRGGGGGLVEAVLVIAAIALVVWALTRSGTNGNK